MAAILSATAKKFRLVFSTPAHGLEACKAAVFAAGAGRYPEGKYTECCWMVAGKGQFRPGDAANPHVGDVGKLEHTEEVRVEVMCFGEETARKAVTALKEAHPYEEPSYGVYALADF
ncbi:uncharacterized protein RCO7_09169 [Rhynchosporium graminicola]|uniref:ATP phosphoribosyltransferase n=1 Tax=Rhynchosporium graminicola TaxID=2792576 RepID=A0A1E1L364_9HELO|nr:uncharacterized protein RCO7_09169 [Rhynchosporium commune]